MLNITIHERNYKVSDKLRDLVEKKLEKIQKYFDEKTSFIMVCASVSGTERMELTITSKGHSFRAQADSRNMYSNIDIVLGKIERQVVRNKEKLRTVLRHESINEKTLSYTKPKEIWNLPSTEIKKTKSFDIKLMSDTVAELALATLDISFFIYADEKTKNVKVMYKREDGHVGVIDVTNASVKK
ncbi:MAG: ribosome-associated translation inhibitor RaiA [Christensenellaceae bacterium]|jgi:putative sigma-54 modulation protein|nr:ribosome-associated translation inhibitor RaiA [Christensenellaceae bacterium]